MNGDTIAKAIFILVYAQLWNIFRPYGVSCLLNLELRYSILEPTYCMQRLVNHCSSLLVYVQTIIALLCYCFFVSFARCFYVTSLVCLMCLNVEDVAVKLLCKTIRNIHTVTLQGQSWVLRCSGHAP